MLFFPGAAGAAVRSPFAAISMKVFADLLKIPREAPAVSGTVRSATKQGGLLIKDVSWDSIDGERVPAYVIRPAKAAGKLPAIICLHGSSGSRESMIKKKFGIGEYTRYGTQTPETKLLGWARELSRRGYLTLALTQRGLHNRKPGTDARNKDLLVHGRNVMGTIVYEIRQAIGHLESCPDVAADKIGIAGFSFGGITTFYTWLVDDRIAAAASICGGVGSVQRFLELASDSDTRIYSQIIDKVFGGNRVSLGYHGNYWFLDDMLSKGDQGDFAATMAPNPLMLWAPLDDISMPKEGVDRFLEVVEPAYRQAASLDKLVVHRPPGDHAFSLQAFETLNEFLNAQLKGE